jgi:AP-3 complex subunit beta
VKLQIVTLASKLLVLNPTDRTLTLLSRYVFSLARYDLDYDVRDRARMLTSLLSGLVSESLTNGESTEPRAGVVLRREQVKAVLFGGKTADVDLDTHRWSGTAHFSL